jgi:hypothetical protein
MGVFITMKIKQPNVQWNKLFWMKNKRNQLCICLHNFKPNNQILLQKKNALKKFNFWKDCAHKQYDVSFHHRSKCFKSFTLGAKYKI